MFEYLLDMLKQSLKWKKKKRLEEKMRNMSQIFDLLPVGPRFSHFAI